MKITYCRTGVVGRAVDTERAPIFIDLIPESAATTPHRTLYGRCVADGHSWRKSARRRVATS